MDNRFFEQPILNSPYANPTRHWELDEHGQPTQKILETRRRAEFITPIPKPKKRKKAAAQEEIVFDEGKGLSTKAQQPQSVAGDAGDGSSSSALAPSHVQRCPPVLLPGGGGGNRDLAHRALAPIQTTTKKASSSARPTSSEPTIRSAR